MTKTYSFSKLQTFLNCPKRYYHKYILKDEPFTSSVQLERGSFLHKLIEEYPNKSFDFNLKFHSDEDKMKLENFFDLNIHTDETFQNIYKYKIEQELTFYLDKDLNEVKKSESTFNGIVDFIGKKDDSIFVVDWKSGKSLADPLQLEFYGMYALSKYNVDKVYVMMYYIDTKKHQKAVYNKSQLNLIKEKWLGIIETIETTETFNPTFNKKCDYCPHFGLDCNPIKMKKGK